MSPKRVVDLNNFSKAHSNSYILSLVGGFDMADDNRVEDEIRSYSRIVDSAIRSCNCSDLGASPLHSFGSIVDCAIRSDTASSFGASPEHGFAWAEDTRTVAAPSSSQVEEVVSNATRHVAPRLFTLAELKAATNNFSLENKIGVGSFGAVYRGKLVDGREVAIKRGKTGSKNSPQTLFGYLLTVKRVKTNSNRKELLEIFGYLLTLLPSLHHKHLVGLVGFCEEKKERLMVLEYMNNGSLHHHLHDKGSSVLNNWKMRIQIALDAFRGLEYLHNHALPFIIHKDVKSSNIVLDATWTARLSNFALSIMIPEPEDEYEEVVMGTLRYFDPEYFIRGVVTAKSDVYGFGVVLLELLTGKTALFSVQDGEYEGTRFSDLLTFALPVILSGEFVKILDPRVGPPDVNEAEALELLANTAILCVIGQGQDRPTITEILLNLERASAICDG